MASVKCPPVKWPFGKMSIQGNGISAKWHFGETFLRRNCFGEMGFGEMNFGEKSGYQFIPMENNITNIFLLSSIYISCKDGWRYGS
jgi:hypothetical protein